jgi:hypothetical protein
MFQPKGQYGIQGIGERQGKVVRVSIQALASALLLGVGSFAATPEEPPLNERTSTRPFVNEEPQSLLSILGTIRDIFNVRISRETPLEDGRGADTPEKRLLPFEIERGETFEHAIRRLEEASEHHWKFEEIHGVPVVRLNPEVVAERTALDTEISLHVDKASIWDSLCALARAINRKNAAADPTNKPLQIWPSGPEMFKRPAPIIMEDSIVTLDLVEVSARKALCAILESAHGTLAYFYERDPDLDHIVIVAYSTTNSSVHGGNMPAEKKEMNYWTLENIGKLQS